MVNHRYDVFWTQSKTGNNCTSVSTDGRMLWWDTRRLGEPIDEAFLTPSPAKDASLYGGSAMEFSMEAGPTKFLVGTEQGVVLNLNTRNKKKGSTGIQEYDTGVGRHHGPIVSIQRNPVHSEWLISIRPDLILWTRDVLSEQMYPLNPTDPIYL